MTDTITKKLLVEKGYFPKELIPAFTTENLAKVLQYLPNNLEALSRKHSRYCSHSFPKVKHIRRNLGIPNPLHQIQLCQVLNDYWTEINKLVSSSNISLSTPTACSDGKRALVPALDAEHSQLTVERAIRSAGYRYCLYTDISRYYSTIYTHTIPWAIHTKKLAKTKRNKNSTYYGNCIDKCVRNTQDGQTLGIPIGPDSSLVISEIIGAKIDNLLQEEIKDELRGIRYIDDYYLYFNERSKAEYVLAKLHKVLQEFELDANPTKTSIIELPEPLEALWLSDLKSYPLNSNIRHQQSQILSFFNKVFEYSKVFPNDYVLKYSLAKTSRVLIHQDNWSLYESFVLSSIIAEPSVLPTATEILYSYQLKNYPLNLEKISATIASVIAYHSKLNHSYELSWALWLSKTLQLKISEKSVQEIYTVEDSIVALVALNLHSDGLVPSGLDVTEWKLLMTEEELYSKNWLFAYEADIQGLQISRNQNHVESDDFFSILKSNQVSFYDSKKQVPLLDGLDEEDYSDREEELAFYSYF
jgi:hypothetical protein